MHILAPLSMVQEEQEIAKELFQDSQRKILDEIIAETTLDTAVETGRKEEGLADKVKEVLLLLLLLTCCCCS